jgi:hypothetical protein
MLFPDIHKFVKIVLQHFPKLGDKGGKAKGVRDVPCVEEPLLPMPKSSFRARRISGFPLR